MDNLSVELIVYICKYLNVKDQLQLAISSKTYYNVIINNILPINYWWYKKQNSKHVNNEYITLYVDQRYPVNIFIHENESYIDVDPLTNYSLFKVGGSATGLTCKTSFYKLRIDLFNNLIKTDDFVFSNTDGGPIIQKYHNGMSVLKLSKIPYATARSSIGHGDISGICEINIPNFYITSEFSPRGCGANGSMKIVSNNDNSYHIKIRGGGYAGGVYSILDDCKHTGEGKNGGWALKICFRGF